MFYWIRRIIEPNYIDNLCARHRGTIEAIREFVSAWPSLIYVPQELIERLTFDECRTFLTAFSHSEESDIYNRISMVALKRHAVNKAKTFEDFEYLYHHLTFSRNEMHLIDQIPAGMARTADSFKRCIEALDAFQRRGLLSVHGVCETYEGSVLIEKTFSYAQTPKDFSALAKYCNMQADRKQMAEEIKRRATSARDLLRVYELDKSDPHLLVRALELPGTDTDYLEIACLIEIPEIRLQAIDKARAALSASISYC